MSIATVLWEQDLQDEFATLPETAEDKDYDMCVSRKISDVAIE